MDFYLFFFLFVFHKEFLVISHNFNDQVYTIIIAQPNLDNQIGAIERVDINPQPLKYSDMVMRQSLDSFKCKVSALLVTIICLLLPLQ